MREYLAPEVEIIENINTSTMDDFVWTESDTDIEVDL